MMDFQAIKGKSAWSGPYGWAYMDMMMTGGQGCQQPDPHNPNMTNPDKPCHAPGSSDAEYRTEGATYAVSASPMHHAFGHPCFKVRRHIFFL